MAPQHVYCGRDVRGEEHNGWRILGGIKRRTIYVVPSSGARVAGRWWRVECVGCGLRRKHVSGNLFTGRRRVSGGGGCPSCAAKAAGALQSAHRQAELDRIPCRCCGRHNLKSGRTAHEFCESCQRRGIRNGHCECGLPLYRTRPCRCSGA